MTEVIFLVHRLPYPPDKGDKIRSYHLLKHFSKKYDVHLGCFVDDPNDEQYLDKVDAFCATTKIIRLDPGRARIKSARGLLSRQALSVPYYYDKALSNWVDATLRERNVHSVIAYSSPMGQYVMGPQYSRYRRIMDFVDVDSDKWRQYAKNKRWPMSWVYNRESRHLVGFERSLAREFDASIFVTTDEVKLFSTLAPDSIGKLHAVANGVATDFFDPKTDMENPYSESVSPVVFTGMMDYWANVDGVTWFAKEVLPAVRSLVGNAEFWIVGASPTREVLALASLDGVSVTGRVPDVRPYLKHAKVVVSPLRIARGIQNKVLEALSMGCQVICTTHAATGLVEPDNLPVIVADTAQDMSSATVRILRASQNEQSRNVARDYALNHYGWDHNLSKFERIHLGVARS